MFSSTRQIPASDHQRPGLHADLARYRLVGQRRLSDRTSPLFRWSTPATHPTVKVLHSRQCPCEQAERSCFRSGTKGHRDTAHAVANRDRQFCFVHTRLAGTCSSPPLRNVAEQAKPEKEISRNILAGLSTLGGRHQALEFGVVIPSGPIGDASSLSGVFLAQALKTAFEVGGESRCWTLVVA